MTRKSFAIAALVTAHVLAVATGADAGTPPVALPEPTTLSLLGAGAVIVGIGAWWRYRK